MDGRYHAWCWPARHGRMLADLEVHMSAPTIPADKVHLTREEINRKQKEYIFPSVTTYFSDPVPMNHAFMQHVWDVEGKKYLDFFGGIVTISVGHCNPRVIERTKAQ